MPDPVIFEITRSGSNTGTVGGVAPQAPRDGSASATEQHARQSATVRIFMLKAVVLYRVTLSITHLGSVKCFPEICYFSILLAWAE